MGMLYSVRHPSNNSLQHGVFAQMVAFVAQSFNFVRHLLASGCAQGDVVLPKLREPWNCVDNMEASRIHEDQRDMLW